MKFWVLLLMLLSVTHYLSGFSATLRNELASTGVFYFEQESDQFDLSLLYQPEINATHTFNPDFSIYGQAMGNAQVRQIFRSGDDAYTQRGKLYRLWFKAGSPQLEARIGLQRLNFGSAQLLRPLQWFDNLDPTDILEQTEGVQAILVRKYFLNNANYWLWGIRGEGKPRGETPIATKEGTLEMGGRIQLPLPNGEWALSFTRMPMTTINGQDSGQAGRLGFDTRLDFDFGLWLEGNFVFIEKYPNPDSIFTDNTIYKLQAPVTLGTDYTWSVGNGIYTMAEIQLWAETGSPVRKLNRQYITFAMTANYPIGLLDTVHYFGVVRDDATISTHTLAWRRMYDRWSFDASLFWDAGKLYNQYNSRGIKLVAAYVF